MYYVTRKGKLYYARYEKPLKTTLQLEVGKNIVETYSSYNAAALTLKKGYNFIRLDITPYTNAKENEKKH